MAKNRRGGQIQSSRRDGKPKTTKDSEPKTNCWNHAVMVSQGKDNDPAKAKSDDFYSKAEAGLCRAIDGFTTQSFIALSIPSNFDALVQERAP